MENSKIPTTIDVDKKVDHYYCSSMSTGSTKRKSKRDFMEILESVPSPCSLLLLESFNRKMEMDVNVGIGRVVLAKPQEIVPIFATEESQRVGGGFAGRLQLDPQDFVEFGNEDEDITNHPLVRSVACGNSQPMDQMDACVGNSQPHETVSGVPMVDSCVGSSQPLVEMIDESIETTTIEVKDNETMTKVDPQGLLKRAGGNFAFYGYDVTESKKSCNKRIILGNVDTMNNNNNSNSAFQSQGIQGNNMKGVDYAISGGANQRTLVYPSQINQGIEEDQEETSPLSAVGTRVPVLRVGLSKKVRPPRLLSQYRSVPAESVRMETGNYGNDEDKEN